MNKCILLPQKSMRTIYAIEDTGTGAFMMYETNKVLRQSTLHDCIMVSHIHLDNTNIHTSRDLVLILIQAVSNDSNLTSKLLTSSTIKDIVKSILISNDGNCVLVFVGSLQRMVNQWLLKEGI